MSPLLDYIVRPERPHLKETLYRRDLRYWRTLLLFIAFSIATTYAIAWIPLPARWQNALQTCFSWSLFCLLPVWAPFSGRSRLGSARPVALGVIILAITLLGFGLSPQPQGSNPLAQAFTVAGSLLMVGCGALLVRIYRAQPDDSWAQPDENRTQSDENRAPSVASMPPRLDTASWPYDLSLGALCGLCLGAHFLFTTHYAQTSTLHWPGWSTWVWYIGYFVGLKSLGEEVLFRGVGMPLLRERLNRGFWHTVATLGALNLLVYLTTGLPGRTLTAALWLSPYLIALVLINAALRQWRSSLVPALASNVAFNLALLLREWPGAR